MTSRPTHPLRRAPSALRAFLAGEAGSGALLILAALVAMLTVNLSAAGAALYDGLLHWESGLTLTAKLGPMTPHLWINDGLMAIFFFVVGLEIKREWLDGRLSTWDQRRLPIVAAVAGMVVPAAVYLAIAGGYPELHSGWAIPAATDIAFAIGVLALLGKRAPLSLKLLLTTIAIVDDMGAVMIIAIVYTASLNSLALLGAALLFGAMMMLNRLGVNRLWPYVLLALLLWYCVLLSGVHATIAGVLAAFAIPIRITPGAPDAPDSPLHRLEHGLHPWSAYLIVPIFGFANAGVALQGDIVGQLTQTLPVAIAAGLFLGKQIGIFGAIRLAVAMGLARRPRGTTWPQIYGLSLLCGIGFTMSLFIGGLAFPGRPDLAEEAKVGILMGSLFSAVIGYAVLRLCPLAPDHAFAQRAMEDEIETDGDSAP